MAAAETANKLLLCSDGKYERKVNITKNNNYNIQISSRIVNSLNTNYYNSFINILKQN